MVWILSRNERFWITEQGENATMCHSKSDKPSAQKIQTPFVLRKEKGLGAAWLKLQGASEKGPALTSWMESSRRGQTSVTDEHDPAFLGDNQAVYIFSTLTDVSDKSNSEGPIMFLVFDKHKIKSVKSVSRNKTSVSRNKTLCRQSIKWPKAGAVPTRDELFVPSTYHSAQTMLPLTEL